MIVDGDMEALGAGAWVAESAIAGGADAGAAEAAQLLDVEMEEFARKGAFVALSRWFAWLESGQLVETVPPQDARECGFGGGQEGEDLGVGTTLAAQSEDLRFEFGIGFTRLAVRN